MRAGPQVPFPRGVVSDHISHVAPSVFLGAGPTGGLVLQAEDGALGAPDLASASVSPHILASRIAHRCSSSGEAGPGGKDAANALERTLVGSLERVLCSLPGVVASSILCSLGDEAITREGILGAPSRPFILVSHLVGDLRI